MFLDAGIARNRAMGSKDARGAELVVEVLEVQRWMLMFLRLDSSQRRTNISTRISGLFFTVSSNHNSRSFLCMLHDGSTTQRRRCAMPAFCSLITKQAEKRSTRTARRFSLRFYSWL